MAVNLAPIGNDAPFVDSSGNPLSSGNLYTYTAGSSTPQNTYTTSAGSVANANPIVLNSNGYPASGGSVVSIWLTAGVSYKFVLKDSGGTTIWTRDNISGINDTTVTIDQWVSGPTPTYVSATSFTLAGDQTSTFQVGRRLKTTNSGGTIYSTIASSAYAVLTTITVVNDSGTLDSGLSAVSYGLLSASNRSTPPLGQVIPLGSVSGTNTITASGSLQVAPLASSQVFLFTPANTNTGATTLNINSVGAKNIYAGNSALVGGELHANIPVLVQYDGTQFQLIGPVFKQPTRTVLTSGTGATYTTPLGATRLEVRVKGGGGSGNDGGDGSGNGGGGGGGGGGEGGTAVKRIVGPSSTYTYTVGGAASNSSFGSVTGNSGSTGSVGNTTPRAGVGGAGGSGSGGDFTIYGAAGQSGDNGGGGTNANVGGIGGAGGGSGSGVGGTAGSNGVAASANSGAGGGGGGGGDGTGGAHGNGGGGAAGIIIVDEYYD